MAGFRRENLIGRKFLDIYPEGVSWMPYCQEVREKKVPVHACVYSKETRRWLDFTVGPTTTENAVAFIFTDVDESVRKTRRVTKTDSIILRISKLLNNEEDFEAGMNHALEDLSRYIHPDRLMEDLNRLSHMDTLTDVFNRNAMISRMHVLAEQNISIGLVYADVNGLKIINDEQGHEAGDQALQSAADLLGKNFGRGHVYRAGGDEFVVILPGIREDVFTEKIEKLTAGYCRMMPHLLSIGSFWCPDSSRSEEALRVADHHMYEEKKQYYEQQEFDRRNPY